MIRSVERPPFSEAAFPIYSPLPLGRPPAELPSIVKGSVVTPYFTYETTVRYTDIGPDGSITQKGMLGLLQEAAALASDQAGYGLKDVPVKRVAWLLINWRLEMAERLLWPAPITVHTWPRSLDGFFSDRDFEVFSQGRLVARATSRWALVDIDTGHTTRITPEVEGAYTLDPRAVFDTPVTTLGRANPDAAETFTQVIGRRDIDTNRHVNNLHYLDYAMEALPEEVWKNLPPSVEILYRKQIRLGTAIRCLYSFKDGRHQVEIRSDQSRTPHAFVWFS